MSKNLKPGCLCFKQTVFFIQKKHLFETPKKCKNNLNFVDKISNCLITRCCIVVKK